MPQLVDSMPFLMNLSSPNSLTLSLSHSHSLSLRRDSAAAAAAEPPGCTSHSLRVAMEVRDFARCAELQERLDQVCGVAAITSVGITTARTDDYNSRTV